MKCDKFKKRNRLFIAKKPVIMNHYFYAKVSITAKNYFIKVNFVSSIIRFEENPLNHSLNFQYKVNNWKKIALFIGLS